MKRFKNKRLGLISLGFDFQIMTEGEKMQHHVTLAALKTSFQLYTTFLRSTMQLLETASDQNSCKKKNEKKEIKLFFLFFFFLHMKEIRTFLGGGCMFTRVPRKVREENSAAKPHTSAPRRGKNSVFTEITGETKLDNLT